MAVLVGYASSDEDDEAPSQAEEPLASKPLKDLNDKTQTSPVPVQAEDTKVSQPDIGAPTEPRHAVTLGPARPPPGAAGDSLPGYEAPHEGGRPNSPPPSFSGNGTFLQDLTLPSVPDLDIPPSPPGSPPAALGKKFEQFLALKRKGIHFNARLEQSQGLKNPSAMDKLLGFVGVDGVTQYETVLGTDLWDPSAFPKSAYREGLKKDYERIAKERETERNAGGRSAVEFVPSVASTGSTSGTGSGYDRGKGARR